MQIDKATGRVKEAEFIPSPNFDDREFHSQPEVIVVHSISLPPGEYGNGWVADFFCNRLDYSKHPYFATIKDIQVSAHFFIQRDGKLLQFVSTDRRAWHAGESRCLGKAMVNDFSIGIELEGLDVGDDGYSQAQYTQLNALIDCLREHYPAIDACNIFAHSDIATGRKTDPGPNFDWKKVFK